MRNIYRIEKVSCLNLPQYREVEELVRLSFAEDEIELPLFMELEQTDPNAEVNHFLAYAGGILVGFMSFPPDDEVEVVGIVHPLYRRQGVGQCLLDAVLGACRRRKTAQFLLVALPNLPSGILFAEAVGGRYRFSEYRLELHPERVQGVMAKRSTVMLLKASDSDLMTLVSIQNEAFRMPKGNVERIRKWLEEPCQRLYLGVLSGVAIGMLRVSNCDHAPNDKTTYISSFGVLPEFQGQGIGKLMLLQTIEMLLAEAMNPIRIEVNVANRNALGLYQSCGFEVINEYRYYDVEVS